MSCHVMPRCTAYVLLNAPRLDERRRFHHITCAPKLLVVSLNVSAGSFCRIQKYMFWKQQTPKCRLDRHPVRTSRSYPAQKQTFKSGGLSSCPKKLLITIIWQMLRHGIPRLFSRTPVGGRSPLMGCSTGLRHETKRRAPLGAWAFRVNATLPLPVQAFAMRSSESDWSHGAVRYDFVSNVCAWNSKGPRQRTLGPT